MHIKLLDLDSQRRDNILNAALKEFALKGFDHASTNVIAKEARLSKALMFHYVNSKQDLFLFVFDYFNNLLQKEYFTLIDFSDSDLFRRLHHSYLLQIKLLKKYPWIFEFSKLSVTTNSAEINQALEKRAREQQSSCYERIFDEIDESAFKKDLDIEKCKQMIYFANIGFTNQILNEIRNSQSDNIDIEHITKQISGHIDDLRKIFCTPNKKQGVKQENQKKEGTDK